MFECLLLISIPDRNFNIFIYQGGTVFYQPVAHCPGCPVLPVFRLRIPEVLPPHSLFHVLCSTLVQTLLRSPGRSLYELGKSKSV